jgi:hypothetical protein
LEGKRGGRGEEGRRRYVGIGESGRIMNNNARPFRKRKEV